MSITIETRRASNETVDRQTMYNIILEVMGDEELTAREIKDKGHFEDMNVVRPRLTELEGMHKVEIIGKKICQHTRKKVVIYRAVG